MTAACPVLPSPPPADGAPGAAFAFYFEREFGRNAVKLMPGEFFVADTEVIICTVLGSCVAACLCDRTARVGGMNHFMLPGADTGGGALAAASGRYGAYAMEQLINEMLKRGAAKANLQAKVFGGGALMRNLTTLRVGERNAAFVLEYLRAEGIRVVSQDLLGLYPRRVAFFATSGRALCKRLAETDRGLLAAERQYAARINASELGGAFELF